MKNARSFMYTPTTVYSASVLLLQGALDFILPTVSVHISPAVALQDGTFPVRDVTFSLTFVQNVYTLIATC